MEKKGRNLDTFLDQLASASPTPGGGSWAALSGALGVALTSMVCSLTVGKEKYQQFDGLNAQALADCTGLRQQFLEGIQEDIEAFNQMGQVFQMDRATESDKLARKEAMQNALKICTMPPIHLMQLSLEGLKITQNLVGNSNPTAVSDLGCAALALKSTLQGGYLNVCINLNSIQDQEFVKQYRNISEELVTEGVKMADEIYDQVLKLV